MRSPQGTVKLDDQFLRDIVVWDVRTWSAAIRYWDAVVEPAPPVLECLEVGAGAGGPSLWLAMQGHHVICSNPEGSEAMAAGLHSRYEPSGSIEYRDLDAKDLPYRDAFDLIVFKSVLGGIGDEAAQRKAIAEMLAALKPGGRLLFAENVQATVLHRLGRGARMWGRRAKWWYNDVDRLRALLGGFSSVQVRTTGVVAMFGPTEWLRTRLAGLDRALNRVTPERWRYVAYGVATK